MAGGYFDAEKSNAEPPMRSVRKWSRRLARHPLAFAGDAKRTTVYPAPVKNTGDDACLGANRASPARAALACAGSRNDGSVGAKEDAIAMKNPHGPLRVGIGGPVGSGKTALMDLLCKKLRDRYEIAAITNDIYTKWDAEYLVRSGALPAERIAGVETGGCPHTAIREDASINLCLLYTSP